MAMGAAFVANYTYLQRKQPGCADAQCALMRAALRWIAVAAVLLVGVELVVLPIYLATVAVGSTAGLASVQLMIGAYGWALVLRVILAFVGRRRASRFPVPERHERRVMRRCSAPWPTPLL